MRTQDMERNLKKNQNQNWTRGKIKIQTGKASFVWAEPDPIDTIERSRSARLRAVEEFDGVGVEREPLQELDCLLWEDVVELKDVDDHVDEGASNDQDTKEYDHSDHNPVACFKRNLIYKKSE